MNPCTCPIAGYCPTFGKIQTERQWKICKSEVLTPEACDAYRGNWLGVAMAGGHHDPLACVHRGDMIAAASCFTCGKRDGKAAIFACGVHGRCSLKLYNAGQQEARCESCLERLELRVHAGQRQRIDGGQLLAHEWQFNNSLIRYRDRWLMAYRLGWNDARLAIAELDDNLQPIQSSRLALNLGHAQEDPRLWTFRGELYVSFSAVFSKPGGKVDHTDVCYARLDLAADGRVSVADEFAPRYAGRQPWEKNWGFFEHAEQLYAVYSIKPHRVLRIDGDAAELVSEQPCPFPRKAGFLHGGAPPVYHNGEFYSFYHRRLGGSSEKFYTLDLYTFEASMPFRPSRHVELPLLLPDRKDRPPAGPLGPAPHAVFPGGAVLAGDDWLVSLGYYDKWCDLVRFDAEQIERCLVKLPGSPWADVYGRRGTADLAAWPRERFRGDLPAAFTERDIVIEIGSGTGAFANECLRRGAGMVIGVERDPELYELGKKNLAWHGWRFDHYFASVGPSLAAEGTRSVPLADVLPDARIRLLRIACRGAHEILAGVDLSRVEQLIVEHEEPVASCQ